MEEVYVEDFSSPGCVECPAVKAMLEELSAEVECELIIEEVDISTDATRAAQYGIMSVPAIAINGVLKFVGLPDKAELKKAITDEFEEQ